MKCVWNLQKPKKSWRKPVWFCHWFPSQSVSKAEKSYGSNWQLSWNWFRQWLGAYNLQAIVWTKVRGLSELHLRTFFGNIGTCMNSKQTWQKKMHLKLSDAKWQPFSLGLNVLTLLFLYICGTQTSLSEYLQIKAASIRQDILRIYEFYWTVCIPPFAMSVLNSYNVTSQTSNLNGHSTARFDGWAMMCLLRVP